MKRGEVHQTDARRRRKEGKAFLRSIGAQPREGEGRGLRAAGGAPEEKSSDPQGQGQGGS